MMDGGEVRFAPAKGIKTSMLIKELVTDLGNRRGRSFVRCALLLGFILAFFMPEGANAQKKVLSGATLTDTTQSLTLSPYTIIQHDPDGRITPQSITQSGGAVLNGRLSEGDIVMLGYGGDSVWLTIKLFNASQNDSWIINMGSRSEGRFGYLKSARAYEMTIAAGSPPQVTPIKALSNNGTYKITIAPSTEKYILLNLQPSSGRAGLLPLKIYKEDAYLSHALSHASLFPVYPLGILVFGIFFAAIALMRGERKILIFSGYFIFMAASWIAHEHIGIRIGSGFYDMLIPVLILGFSLFSIAMAKIFYDIEYGSFTEKYILYGLAWLNILATLLSFLLPVSDGLTQIALLNGAPMITLTILFLMAWAQSRSGQADRTYYLCASAFPLMGLIAVVAGIFDVVPGGALQVNALWYSIAPQGLLMLIAVHKKIKSDEQTSRTQRGSDTLNLSRLKQTKDNADHTRLLKVIEKEREILGELRAKEQVRVEEMRHAKEAADEANRAKSAFLAVVSHEIRTPMTGVMGMVRLLLDSSITKQQRDYVLTIQESSEAMLALLNDILDFERIQRGKIDLENISFDLHRLMQGVVTLMSGHAADKHIALSARIDEDLPRFVKGDPTRLRQVLLNLMGNAIKFTQNGTVTLMVKSLNTKEQDAANDSGKHMIYFAVQDTGIGISDEARKNLFTPFAQANSSIARKFGGTGLGLAISKGLVERMGSTININSKEGEGSTFFFTLEMEQGLATTQEQPLQKAMPQQHKQHEAPATPLRILIVDDNTITRKVLMSFLEKGGHDIATISTGEDALKKINQDAFDLILMDIELPGLKGNEVTKFLRAHKDPVKSKIPVIAMSGNTAKEDIEHYIASGMDGYLPKPIDMDKLQALVNDIAHDTFEREIRMSDEDDDPFARSPEQNAQVQQQREAVMNDGTVFNPAMLQSLKDTIGAAQLNELLTDLIIKTDEILGAMDDATKVGDLQSLAARAHELKGMAGNFGLVEISAIAAQAERKAKTSETEGLSALVGTLTDANLRAQGALKNWAAH